MHMTTENLHESADWMQRWEELREALHRELLLSHQVGKQTKTPAINRTYLMRLCLATSLADSSERQVERLADIQMSGTNLWIGYFGAEGSPMRGALLTLLRLRYRRCAVDWSQGSQVSRVIAQEVLRGLDTLLAPGALRNMLLAEQRRRTSSQSLPELRLDIGVYAGSENRARLDLNSRQVTNSHILVAGTTGSGKTNLLCLLIEQLRGRSAGTQYPVNILLFDYKGEFSDPANRPWLGKFQMDPDAINDPIDQPLPFSPFKAFNRAEGNEINNYATTIAGALCHIYGSKPGAKQSTHLSEAIIDAYKTTQGKPINFKLLLEGYRSHLKEGDEDLVTNALGAFARNNYFANDDLVDLVNTSLIINLGRFAKDGPAAKAIVYFVIGKLHNLYEGLPQQATDDNHVQLRHYTVIDEAHYMLSFDNQPLRQLMAVGRNKGMNVILATQNLGSFRQKTFDLTANANNLLIMKQQSLDDKTLGGFYGLHGAELRTLQSEIAGLQKGELILKGDPELAAIGYAKPYSKVKADLF